MSSTKRGTGNNSKRLGRSLLMLFLAFGMLLLCFGNVAYIKIVHGEEYQQSAELQQLSSTDVTIPALRGSIYDRNGNVLAKSSRVYNVIVDPQVLIESDTSKQVSTIEILMGVLGFTDEAVIRQYMTSEYEQDRYERLKEGRRISAAKMEEIQAGIDSGKVVGIWFEEDEERTYENDALAAHIIGFDGNYGVEEYYDSFLCGEEGRKMVVAGGGSNFVEEYIPAQNGKNLTLTIDSKVQYYMEQLLQDGVLKTNALRGAAICMNCKTGEILGLAVVPTFNLNDVNQIYGVSGNYNEHYSDKNDPEYYARIWNDFAVSMTYEPGSTFKPVFAAAALNEGVVNETDSFYCSGEYQIYDASVNCANMAVHGVEDVKAIIRNSCNIGMSQISERFPTAKWLQYQEAFGLAQLTGIDLSGEAGDSRNLIYISSEEARAAGTFNDMGPFEKATTSFGQGFTVTPIQMLCAFNAVVNGGEYLKPYVVSQITDEAGNLIQKQSRQVLRSSISSEVSTMMRDYLREVVVNGNGRQAMVPGYDIGGKSGTAQKGDESGTYAKEKYIVSFCSFTPVDDPEIMLLVILDETNEGNSAEAALLNGQIMEVILPAMGIYPDANINPDVVSPSTVDIRDPFGKGGEE